MEALTEQNAILVTTTRHFERYANSPITAELLKHSPTRLFLPDDIAVDYYPEVTGLTLHQNGRHMAAPRIEP